MTGGGGLVVIGGGGLVVRGGGLVVIGGGGLVIGLSVVFVSSKGISGVG